MASGDPVTMIGRRFRARLALLGLTTPEATLAAVRRARNAAARSDDSDRYERWAEQLESFSAGSIASACRSNGLRLTTLRKLAAIAQTSVSYLIGENDDPAAEDYAGAEEWSGT